MDDIEKGKVSFATAEGQKDEVVFVPTDTKVGLTSKQVEAARERFGLNRVNVPCTPTYVLFIRQFVGFLPLLIELSALISLLVKDYTDFAIILTILVVNALLGFREEVHAKRALEAVSSNLVSEVAVRRDGALLTILTTDLVPGDIVLLVGGSIVPADIKWISGDTLELNTAALTGEPLPRRYPSKQYGDILLSGTTVMAGECYGQVIAIGLDTEMGQAQADVLPDKSVHVVSVFQQKIAIVVQILVVASLQLVFAVLLVKGITYEGFENDVRETVLVSLSILIAAIPVALPLVIQVNLALGASFLATKHHAIVTSIPALQDIASMSMLCSDKTGTLTTANMTVIPERIFAADGFTPEQVILYAYLCSNGDKKEDPIDQAIVSAFSLSPEPPKAGAFKQVELIGFNPVVKRVIALVELANGEMITVAKGLPAKVIDTTAGGIDTHEFQWRVEQADNESFMRNCRETDAALSRAGYKTIAIAMCNGNARTMQKPKWNFVGLIPMLDPPREDTYATVESLHHANISVKMITGDHQNVGKETARLIGLGTDIRTGEDVRKTPSEQKKLLIWEADGFASVLPSDKREVVLTLRNELGVVTGMTGDGVNDAPALAAAQVGIAVQGSTDAAKNAADLILTGPGLSPIYGAVLESRRIFIRIKSYVIYRVAASIIMVLTLSLVLFASGCAIDPLLVIILALLNDISMIPVAYDTAQATTKPQLPRARTLVLMSLYYGLMQTAAGMIFIFIMSDAENASHYDPIELTHHCDERTKGLLWFHLVLVTELLIFSVRAPGFFLFSSPSIFLMFSVLSTCVGGVVIAVYATGITPRNVFWIVMYDTLSLIITDFGKLYFRHIIGDSPGSVIETDDLRPVPDGTKSEAMRKLEKKMRYIVHNEMILSAEERQHVVQFRSNQHHGLSDFSERFLSTDVTLDLDESYANRRFMLSQATAASSGTTPTHTSHIT